MIVTPVVHRPHRLSLRLFAAALGLACFASACRCDRRTPTHDAALERETFGSLPDDPNAIAHAIDLEPLLVKARAVIEAKPSPPLADAPGRRVFLTAYEDKGLTKIATGIGKTIDVAVADAANHLASQHPIVPFRISIDVVDRITPIRFDPDLDVPNVDIGIEGYASAKKGAFGYMTPADVIEEKAFVLGSKSHIVAAKVNMAIELRAGVAITRDENAKTYSVHTQSAIESSSPSHLPSLAMMRGAVLAPTSIDPASLLTSVKMGADYLSRIVGDDGRFTYSYAAASDKDGRQYGLIRHAGTTYALLEAYEEFRAPVYLGKAEQALAYLRSRIKVETSPNGEKIAHLLESNDGELQKVGGAGLSLVAMSKRAILTGDHSDLELMRQLALLIVRQQYADGHFRANADLEREGLANGKKLKTEVIYYIGEALLGLMRLYAIDPDPRWLTAAKKGADYCVDVRDVNTTDDTQEHDHWLSYALGDLFRETHDARYKNHAYRIARAIVHKQKTAADVPIDMVGSFYNEGDSTPAATRLEAYASDIQMAQLAGDDAKWMIDPAIIVAKFIKGHQFGDDNSFMLPNPEKARGGLRKGLFDDEIRIDYVQHAMSGWLHLARAIDPAHAR